MSFRVLSFLSVCVSCRLSACVSLSSVCLSVYCACLSSVCLLSSVSIVFCECLSAFCECRSFVSLYVSVCVSSRVRLSPHLVLCSGHSRANPPSDGNASCVRAYVSTTEASSPAISNMEQNVLFSFDDEKAKTSAVWTESVWSPNTLTARIFLIPSTA